MIIRFQCDFSAGTNIFWKHREFGKALGTVSRDALEFCIGETEQEDTSKGPVWAEAQKDSCVGNDWKSELQKDEKPAQGWMTWPKEIRGLTQRFH